MTASSLFLLCYNPFAMKPEEFAFALPIKRIREFCVKWGITRFEVFGSILRPDFSAQSDVDVLVSFNSAVHFSLFDLMDMKVEGIIIQKWTKQG